MTRAGARALTPGSTAYERATPLAPAALLLLVAGGCWAVTVHRMRGMDMGPGTDLGGLGFFAVLWLTMMAAMMLPPRGSSPTRSSRSSPPSTSDGWHGIAAARTSRAG